MLRIAADSASILRQTTWHALSRALRGWLTGRSVTSLSALNREARKLVAAEVVRECEAHLAVHPWLQGLRQEPWEAISKLGMLLGTPDLYASQAQPRAPGAEIVAPIYSQPFIELSLRIPADVLFADGRADIKARTGWPDLGMIPWLAAVRKLPAEDAVVLDPTAPEAAARRVKIVAPMFSRIANRRAAAGAK